MDIVKAKEVVITKPTFQVRKLKMQFLPHSKYSSVTRIRTTQLMLYREIYFFIPVVILYTV
jgi:hypothetical protein